MSNSDDNMFENEHEKENSDGKKEENEIPQTVREDDNGFETIFIDDKDKMNDKKSSQSKTSKKKLSKKKKIIITVSSILAVLLVIAGSFGIFVANKLGLINKENPTVDDTPIDEAIYDDSDFSTIDADINASSFREGIKQWATNGGEIMTSKNVINVLIIGYDSRQNTFSGNTDALMLLSLNKKTKTITLSSFLRDSYVYYETSSGETGYNKINALFSIGGADCLLNAIENHYKIEVDDYVAVNFASFESLIDEMGGINVDVQKYEANYYQTYFDQAIPYGDNVLLNGYQTLGFCRIRKCDADGDVSRTRRQQMVIEAIINKVSTASLSDVNNYIDVVLPYVSTDLSNQEIVSLGTRAMLGKWYDYSIQKMQMPTEEARYGYSGSTWIWVIDYPLAAQALQNAIYGSTNIVLTEGRTTIIDFIKGSNTGTGSASAKAVPETVGESQTTAPVSAEPSVTESISETTGIEGTEPQTTENVTGESTTQNQSGAETTQEVTETSSEASSQTEPAATVVQTAEPV